MSSHMTLLAKGMRMQVMYEASQTVSLKGSCCPLKPAGCNRNMAEVSRLYPEDKDNTREGQESWRTRNLHSWMMF